MFTWSFRIPSICLLLIKFSRLYFLFLLFFFVYCVSFIYIKLCYSIFLLCNHHLVITGRPPWTTSCQRGGSSVGKRSTAISVQGYLYIWCVTSLFAEMLLLDYLTFVIFHVFILGGYLFSVSYHFRVGCILLEILIIVNTIFQKKNKQKSYTYYTILSD